MEIMALVLFIFICFLIAGMFLQGALAWRRFERFQSRHLCLKMEDRGDKLVAVIDFMKCQRIARQRGKQKLEIRLDSMRNEYGTFVSDGGVLISFPALQGHQTDKHL